MRFRPAVSVLSVLALALPSSAIAADRYAAPDVPVGGGDLSQCPESDPCNILDALEGGSAAAGDVVRALPGVHTVEEAAGGVPGVSLVGAGAATTRIELVGGAPATMLLSREASVSDVTLDAVAPDGTTARALGVTGGGTVRRVVAYRLRGCALLSGDVVVTDSVCAGSQYGMSVGSNQSAEATLRNVTAVGGQYGLYALQNGAGWSTWVDGVNVIASGATADVYAYTDPFDAAPDTEVHVDLDFSNFSTTAVAGGPGTESITTPGTAGNQTAEPLFVDAAANDLRQATGSPTIDAGDDAASSLGSSDVLGDPRISGAGIDIGAHESVDADGDGVADADDTCPGAANPDQADLDGDGEGDACDGDLDGDGKANAADAFPNDPAEDADSDGDGIGDNADPTPNGEPAGSGGGGPAAPGGAGSGTPEGPGTPDGPGPEGPVTPGGEAPAPGDLGGGAGGDGPVPTCRGRQATIVGTNEGERIVGTSGDDVIVALGGADRIRARGGDDLICAGGGKDRVRAGAGDDRVLGQGGNDRLLGQRGRDVLIGGRGADRVAGGPGRRDSCRGGAGRDRLAGGKRAGCERARR